ncbi:MAG TPA: right-handed parallel beta-helix repeat-containing protein [Armatimonadota bacterium]|nr:right-handed parallel beta-helix repeat-containing protein [Armatimonadota bacterium]
MRNVFSVTIFVIVSIAVYLLALPVQAIDFYVSQQGNDHWSGLLAAPNKQRTDGPFATIAHARDAVRLFKFTHNNADMPMRVVVRGGTYFQQEPLLFTPEDSGTNRFPMIYTAYPGETPVVSGGREITGWKTGTVNGHRCFQVHIPDVAAGQWNFTQLFINGRRALRPRLPREGLFRFAGFTEDAKDWRKGPASARFTDGDVKNWHNVSDVDLIFLNRWYECHERLSQVNEQEHILYFNPKATLNIIDAKGQPCRYYVENVFEAIDTPGQWYLDRPIGMLYYLPLPGETIASLHAVVPLLENVVQVAGRDDANVHHLRFEHLTFSHTDPKVNTRAPRQSASSVPGGVMLTAADNCAFYDCTFQAMGGYALQISAGCADDRIIACTATDLGAGGIRVESGSRHTTIADCIIHHGGRIWHNAAGVLVMDSGYNRVLHNEISDFYYTGISCGWVWGYGPSKTVDNRIEYNLIDNLGYGWLDDMGGIYTLGTQPGTVLRGNVIHDVTSYAYGGWGIYLDEGTSEVLVENNLCYHMENNDFHQHYGRDNWIRNNIFASAKSGPIARTRQEPHRSFVMQWNICSWRDGTLISNWKDGHFLLENNLYSPANANELTVGGLPFAQWQAAGYDQGSMIADPLFTNEDRGDFSLRTGSPATTLGFHAWDLHTAGPRLLKQRPEELDDWPQPDESPATITRSTLEFLGDRQAVGTTGTVRLQIENVGSTPASGSITLRVRPAQYAQLVGNPSVQVLLAPGASQTVDFALSVLARGKEIAVDTVPVGNGLMPTCLYIKSTP